MLRCIAYIQHYIIIAKSTLEFTLFGCIYVFVV